MMEMEISNKKIAKKINKRDLLEIIAEYYLLNKEKYREYSTPEYLLHDIERELHRKPVRDIVNTNQMVLYVTHMFEDNDELLKDNHYPTDTKPYHDMLVRAELIDDAGELDEEFLEFLEEVQEINPSYEMPLYPFCDIQDYIYYEIFPNDR